MRFDVYVGCIGEPEIDEPIPHLLAALLLRGFVSSTRAADQDRDESDAVHRSSIHERCTSTNNFLVRCAGVSSELTPQPARACVHLRHGSAAASCHDDIDKVAADAELASGFTHIPVGTQHRFAHATCVKRPLFLPQRELVVTRRDSR